MYVSLSLQNFRSYKEHSIELSEAVNIVVGPNASGKTNLLEAFYALNQGSSFRASDNALIHYESDWARVDGVMPNQNRSLLLKKTEEDKVQRMIEQDGVKKSRMTANLILPTTLFEPEHLRFLTGSPELRRAYLDGVISQTSATHNSHINQYKRALLQRNRLLKKQPPRWQDQIFVWDLKLSDFGAHIVEARKKLVATINKTVSDIYSNLSETEAKLQLEYQIRFTDKDDYRSALLEGLQKTLETDKLRGSTSLGPHRDDLETSLNGQLAKTSASRGETRTIVMALKIIELQQLEKHVDTKPLLLLDDVFSELDGARRRALTTYLSTYQTIITTTDADAIVKHFLGDSKVILTQES